MPHRDLIVGRRIKKTTGFTVPATPNGLFAFLIANTDGALNDSGGTMLRLLLGAVDEQLTQASARMLLAHGQMADLPLIPLDPLHLDARDDALVACVERSAAGGKGEVCCQCENGGAGFNNFPTARRRARNPDCSTMRSTPTARAVNRRSGREDVKMTICGYFVEPSDGLEPSTPSLPWNFVRNWWQPVATELP